MRVEDNELEYDITAASVCYVLTSFYLWLNSCLQFSWYNVVMFELFQELQKYLNLIAA